MNGTFTHDSNFYLTKAMAYIDSASVVLLNASKEAIALASQKCPDSDKDAVKNFGIRLDKLRAEIGRCNYDIRNQITAHENSEEKSSKMGGINNYKPNFGCEINYLRTALQRALPFLQAELAIAEARFNLAEPMRERVEKINEERHGEYVRTNDAKYNMYKYAGLAAGQERYRITQEIKAVKDFLSHINKEI